MKVAMIRDSRGKFLKRKDAWTEKEDNILRKLYAYAGKKEIILDKLPRRTWWSIKKRAKQLGLYRGNYIPPLDRAPRLKFDEATKAWLSCAIDCEGHISIYRNKRKDLTKGFHLMPRIGFCNTNREIVEEFIRKVLSEKLRLRVIERMKKSNGKWNDKYYTHIYNMGLIYSLLKEIKSYLIVKTRQANLVMKFIEIRDEQLRKHTLYDRVNYDPRLLKIYEEVKGLNGR